MAEQAVQLDQEQLCCSICLDLLKEPVSVPCGHSYCSRCIEGYWDQDDQRGRFSCPQCRETFNPRPVLKKNTMLAEVVESMKKTGLQAVPPDHYYAGPGDVVCDVCTGRKLKAVKTCLQCLVSYCDTHLQPHYQSPAFKKHKLVKASSELQENICSLHDEVKKVFCRTDQQCICYLCCMEEHKGHNTVSAEAERTERQKELDTSQQNIQQRIQEREKDIEVLHQEVKSINCSADRAVDDSDTIFTELISSFIRTQSEVRGLIRDKQKRAVCRAKELRLFLEQDVSQLRRRHAELEQILNTEDDIHFLHGYTSLSKISESKHPVSSNIRPLRYFEDVNLAVSKMRDKLVDILKMEGTNISETVNRVDDLLSTPSEPKTRTEFLKYSRPLTLDPNTAEKSLSLSKRNRKVTAMNKQKSYPHHPQRFTVWWQVLSREALTGRRYWEVEWSGNSVYNAVSYKDISRTGTHNECGFGRNDKSWSLQCCNGYYVFRHKDISTHIPGCVSSRVGVYLDHSAGSLSFYSVSGSDAMTLLHRVQTTFTQPLYAGFWLEDGETAELCDLN